MKTVTASPSEVIRENLPDQSACFVFSTGVAAASWAEWAVTRPELSGTTAVPMERFVAWDAFKTSLIHSREKDCTSVPSLLRKFFIQQLLKETVEDAKTDHPLFKALIPPERAATFEDISSFTDWMTKMLPPLRQWHIRHEAWLAAHGADDDKANADYETLYRRYDSFLKGENRNGSPKFFEPAWIEPDFAAEGRRFIIFYPETIEDYCDYEQMFDRSGAVTEVHLADSAVHPEIVFFDNARTELRCTALRIRKLCADGGVPWQRVAVTVPDIETWRPYLEREFNLYCIPYVMRSGLALTANSAGRIFTEIQDCFENNFSYDSVRALVLDECIPWKSMTVNRNLIQAGYETKSLYNYKDDGSDIWEQSLAAYNTGNTTELELRLYKTLRQRVNALCNASTFAAVKEQWGNFERELLVRDDFSEEADAVLGRCISELCAVIDIEEKYLKPLGIQPVSPFTFYLNQISSVIYQPQQKNGGVSVFPYKLAAAAQYEYHFVLNANQNDLTVTYRSMSFLSKQKRDMLLSGEEIKQADSESGRTSDTFVRLYAACGSAFFTGAEQSFSGFTIPYSYLDWPSDKAVRRARCGKAKEDVRQLDCFSMERAALERGTPGSMPGLLTKLQQQSFARWNAAAHTDKAPYTMPAPLAARIQTKLCESRAEKVPQYAGSVHVSQSDLKDFYPCPRCWLLHSLFHLQEQSLDTDLMEVYDDGKIAHKALELFMGSRSASGGAKRLPQVDSDGCFENEDDLRAEIQSDVRAAFNDPQMSFRHSILVKDALASQTQAYTERIISFLRKFCSTYGGYSVEEVEQYHTVPAECNGVKFVYYGGIDCVLSRGGDSGFNIIDYKNSKGGMPAARKVYYDSETGTPGDFQMPVYVKLWNGTHSASEQIEGAVFYAVKDAGEKRPVLDVKHSALFNETLEKTDSFAAEFVQTADTGAFAPGSRVKWYRDCVDCSYRFICRTTYTAAGERI